MVFFCKKKKKNSNNKKVSAVVLENPTIPKRKPKQAKTAQYAISHTHIYNIRFSREIHTLHFRGIIAHLHFKIKMSSHAQWVAALYQNRWEDCRAHYHIHSTSFRSGRNRFVSKCFQSIQEEDWLLHTFTKWKTSLCWCALNSFSEKHFPWFVDISMSTHNLEGAGWKTGSSNLLSKAMELW